MEFWGFGLGLGLEVFLLSFGPVLWWLMGYEGLDDEGNTVRTGFGLGGRGEGYGTEEVKGVIGWSWLRNGLQRWWLVHQLRMENCILGKLLSLATLFLPLEF